MQNNHFAPFSPLPYTSSFKSGSLKELSDVTKPGSNNKHNNCPAIMNDARIFTDYRPATTIERVLQTENNIANNHQYRQFLIDNGIDVIQKNRDQAISIYTCETCDTRSGVTKSESNDCSSCGQVS